MLLEEVSMSRTRRSYDREFKIEAVRMVVDQGRPVTEVARNLGVSPSLVHRWKAQLLEDGQVAFPGNGNLKPADAELQALRRELETTRQERDILKKALAFFAKDKR